jgi:outer membrane receptor protein involved in Fe transport
VSSNNTVANPFFNNQTVAYFGSSEGNPNLKPEVALTYGLGLVYQPDYFPGFSASFDYFNINIKQAITSYSAQQTLNLCFEGQASACANVSTVGTASNGLPILRIRTSPLNFASETASGFDIAASYQTSLDAIQEGWPGDITLGAIIAHTIENTKDSGATGVAIIDVAGMNASDAPPKWKYQFTAQYSLDPITVGFTLRGISEGKYNSNWITCTTACPVSTANYITTDTNYLPSAWYLDINSRYNISENFEAFFNVKNVFNLDPPVFYPGPGGNAWQTVPAPLRNYDILGRVYRVGVRFKT